MNRAKLSILVILFILAADISIAQFNNYGIKGGVQYSQLIPITEFKDGNPYKPSFMIRGFLRTAIIKELDLEIGGGYGSLSGLDSQESYYQTSFLPFDIRFVLNPFNSNSVNPYLYVGFGAMNYWLKYLPSVSSPGAVKTKGWAAFIPSGIGMEINISNSVILDFGFNFTYTFTDNLNYYTHVGSSPKDAFYGASLGITFFGTSSSDDTDGDGLSDDYENSVGLNPLNPDSDGDSLKDGDELNIYKTSPFSRDSDRDGLNDFEEVMVYYSLAYRADSDNDGIFDGDEVLEYQTDPMKIDTDGDGLNDREEIFVYNTSPVLADTDGDGLTDFEELRTHSTDPLLIDTDGGMADDLVEIENRTNPRDPSDDIVIVGVPLVLSGVSFSAGTQEIAPSSNETLQRILYLINVYPDYRFEVRCYTDNIGDAEYNYSLTQRQAEKIKDWLLARGADTSRLTAIGYGSEDPIASNETLEGRMRNRRVELVRIQ